MAETEDTALQADQEDLERERLKTAQAELEQRRLELGIADGMADLSHRRHVAPGTPAGRAVAAELVPRFQEIAERSLAATAEERAAQEAELQRQQAAEFAKARAAWAEATFPAAIARRLLSGGPEQTDLSRALSQALSGDSLVALVPGPPEGPAALAAAQSLWRHQADLESPGGFWPRVHWLRAHRWLLDSKPWEAARWKTPLESELLAVIAVDEIPTRQRVEVERLILDRADAERPTIVTTCERFEVFERTWSHRLVACVAKRGTVFDLWE
jgi:hypothetical protein